ncbi:MAG: CARDB domain-containing protein, partial [bacterium]
MNFSFKTDYSFIFIPAILIIAFVISYFYYKHTKLDGIQKKLFTALRFLSLFFIFLLLSSPVISFLNSLVQDPVNVFLIDNSLSLTIENRIEQLKKKLNYNISNTEAGETENLYFLFSENLIKELKSSEFESVSYDGINNFQTNLTLPLYDLQSRLLNKNVSSVTLISDGMINEGGNPATAARSLNVPVNYILIGDTIQKNDLVVKNIFYNKTAFIESNVPLKAEINSYGYDRDIKVNLYEEDKMIDSRNLKVINSQNSYEVSFNVTSDAEKISKYKIEIESLSDEITVRNNYTEFFIKFV